MALSTGIEWADATWNPWYGCTKVSCGCAHCYMFRERARYGQDPSKVVRAKTTFRDPLKWKDPLRIFPCSWGDWFHAAADAWRAEAWQIVRNTPHTYYIVTKRPERIAACLPPDWGAGYPNVVLLVSVEDMSVIDRVRILCEIPARARGISAGPLLGMIDVRPYIFRLTCGHEDVSDCDETCAFERQIHWVIAEGESGDDARPTHPEWLRSLREQCLDTETPFFFKRWGEWAPPSGLAVREEVMCRCGWHAPVGAAAINEHRQRCQRGHYAAICRVGKHAAGRQLDGQEWNQFPEVA